MPKSNKQQKINELDTTPAYTLKAQVRKAKILQTELHELGVDNPSLMDILIYQTLLDIRGSF